MVSSPRPLAGVGVWSLAMPIRSRDDTSTPTTTHRKTTSSVSSTSTSTFPPMDMSHIETKVHSNPVPHTSKYHEGLSISSILAQQYRDRSPTSSTMSSSQPPDTATTYFLPMSPTLSTFTRATTPDPESTGITRPRMSMRHRCRVSYDSGSTLVESMYDEDGYPGSREAKMEYHREVPDVQAVQDELDELDVSDTMEQNCEGPLAAGTPRPQTPADGATSPETPPLERHPILRERWSSDMGSERPSRQSQTSIENPMEPPMECSNEEVDDVLNYVLQAVYGVELNEVTSPPALLRHFAGRFIQDVGRTVFRWSPLPQRTHTTSTSSEGSSTTAAASRGTVSRRGSQQQQQQGGKRKKAGPGRWGNEEGDDMGEEEGDPGVPFKRARQALKEPDEVLRLSCPFRKKNPARFNVREHHSCAMTYFPKFAELRQHIVKQHRRADPSAFLCDRCNRDFPCRKDLRDHQRLPREQMCDITDHDPESGIDGSTATKLLSRKRASGTSVDVQWREIWGLLFPDDEDHQVENWDFCPVIEHFEVTTRLMDSLTTLETSLRDKGLNPQALETIGNLYRNQFIQVLAQCVGEAKMRPYSNRSNRRVEPTANSNAFMHASGPSTMRAGRKFASRPDSGVEVDADEFEGWQEGSVSAANFPYPGYSTGCGPDGGWESSDARAGYGTGVRPLMPLIEVVGGEIRVSDDKTVLGTSIPSFSSSMMASGVGRSRSTSDFPSEQAPVSITEHWVYGVDSVAPISQHILASAPSSSRGGVDQTMEFAHGPLQGQYHEPQAEWDGDGLGWPDAAGQEGLYGPEYVQ
ncbi:hypothetical protein ACRALDRAFT_1079156 [Sodiomyces alcalophilus JCM 7366]|uniref:uncharacterized protein n=1 Tax=Sodiomyces alcalophilus JCM 7366 TaxID=591952 RepID=UPI0039B510AE